MRVPMFPKPMIGACAVALTLSVGACANDNRTSDIGDRDNKGNMADATDNRGHEGAPIELTGCLQKGDGRNDYMLTQVNSPSSAVGTSGVKNEAAVEREQIRSASHAYRLDGDNDDFEKLVGKLVRVSGTVEESSEVRQNATEMKPSTDGNRAPAADGNRVEIKEGDLAKVDVNKVERVADECGTPSSSRR